MKKIGIDEKDYSKRIISDVPAPAWVYLKKEKLFQKDGKVNVNSLRSHLLKEGRIHPNDAIKIIRQARDLFKKENNLLELHDPITVCGDVHGQYYDLIKLLSIGGDPKQTQYLFLGDYVDRGFFGTECCFLLFAYKTLYPNRFFMIRGNHECRHLTSYFNFKEECLFKYSLEIYEEIMKCFDCLPVGAILNGRFLCVHGGISPELKTIEEINIIHRFREPPSNGMFCDILWADPMDNEEEEKKLGEKVMFVENQLRGCSYVFSYRAADKFLKENNLLSIIRAHEAQDEGYRLYKKRETTGFPTVICIFSAPNYCDVYNNKGAIIRFKNNLMNIRQFNSSPHPYYLPHFMNAFNWSMPFVIEKVLDIFNTVLNLVEQEPKNEEEVPKKKTTIDEERAKQIRRKIRAVARFSKLYGVLTKERESILELKGLAGGQLPKGILAQGSEAIQKAISSFKEAKESDSPNELIPKTYRVFEKQMSEEDFNKAMSKVKRIRKNKPIEREEIPTIEF